MNEISASQIVIANERENDHRSSHHSDHRNSTCKSGQFVLPETHIRPLTVGSLDYPERYRSLGAFVFLALREVRI